MKRAALVGVLLLALTGCGGSGDRTKTLHVLAAASLTGTFTTLSKEFEAEHPHTRVVLEFGPSSGLAQEIAAGAPADVFASASTTNMDAVVASGDAAGPRTFATNTMEIAVPPDNPARITSLDDLARAKVALCQAQVPCGVAAHKVLEEAHLALTPVTEEVDVKAVLTKVALGEVDAGIVYVTDVQAAGDQVKGIAIPGDVNARTAYPIAALTHSGQSALACEFVDLVLSAKGREALAKAGFAAP